MGLEEMGFKDYGDLLERARSADVTLHELAAVVDELKDPVQGSDLGRLIVILMKAHVPPYKYLVSSVEGFLEGPYTEQEASKRVRTSLPEAWMLTRIATRVAHEALTLLCLYWHRTPAYTKQILNFIRGVPWDYQGRLRTYAMSLAGYYLRDNSDVELLRELIKVYESEPHINTDDIQDMQSINALRMLVHNSAYEALSEAMGRDLKNRPIGGDLFRPLPNIDPKVVQEAHERLARETASTG